MKCKEAKELITAMADGEITKEEEGRLSLHLKECTKCCSRLLEEKVLKKRLRALYKDKMADDALKEEVIRIINERTTTFPAVVLRRSSLPLFAGGVLTVVAVFLFYLFFFYSPETKVFPEKVFKHARLIMDSIRQGDVRIDMITTDPEELTRYFRNIREKGFDVIVHDLSGLGYALVGGGIEIIESRMVSFSVYRREQDILINMMFDGSGFKGEEFGREKVDVKTGMEFYISSWNGVNTVAWWEGEQLCISIATLPHDKIIECIMAEG